VATATGTVSPEGAKEFYHDSINHLAPQFLAQKPNANDCRGLRNGFACLQTNRGVPLAILKKGSDAYKIPEF